MGGNIWEKWKFGFYLLIQTCSDLQIWRLYFLPQGLLMQIAAPLENLRRDLLWLCPIVLIASDATS